jgi:hypothetical protein
MEKWTKVEASPLQLCVKIYKVTVIPNKGIIKCIEQ